MSSIPGRTPLQGAPVYPSPHFSSSQAPSPYHAASYAPQPTSTPYPYYASSYAPSAPAASYALPQPAASPYPYYAPRSVAEENGLSLGLRNSAKLLTTEAFINQLIDETIKKLPSESELSLMIPSGAAFEARLQLCEKVAQEIEQLSSLHAAHKYEIEMRFRDTMKFHLIALEAHKLGQFLLANDRIPEYIENLPWKLIQFETKGNKFPRSPSDPMHGLLTAIFSRVNQHIQELVESNISDKSIGEQVAICNRLIHEILSVSCGPSLPNARRTLEFLNRRALTDFLIERHAPSFAEAFKEGALKPEDLDLIICELRKFAMSEGLSSNPDLHITFIEKTFGTTDMEKLREQIAAQTQPEKQGIVVPEQIQRLWDRVFTTPQQQKQKEEEAQQIEAKQQAQKRVINKLTEIMDPSQPLYPQPFSYPQTPLTDVSYSHFSFSGGSFVEQNYQEIN